MTSTVQLMGSGKMQLLRRLFRFSREKMLNYSHHGLLPADTSSEIAATATVVEPNVSNLSSARDCICRTSTKTTNLRIFTRKFMFAAQEEEAKPERCSTQTALTICHCAGNTCQNILLDIDLARARRKSRRTTRS